MQRNYVLPGVLVFGVGIAVGWFSRGAADGGAGNTGAPRETPAAAKAPASRAADPPADKPAAVVTKRAIREDAPKKPAREIGPDSEEMKKIQSQMAKAMADRQRAKFTSHLTKLADALALTDAQKSDLTRWIDERVGKLETLDFSEFGKPGTDANPLEALTLDGLEKQLAASLTGEQKSALEGFKERERLAKIDSLALKSLSQMQGVIDFEEGQRDEVYKILSDAAAEKLREQSANPDPSSLFTDGMGIEMDPYDLGVQDAMREAFTDVEDPTKVDQKQMAEKLREVINRRIDEKVERLRPVLNEKQLEQYRAELKNKGSGFLGNALIGMDAAAGEGGTTTTTIEIPAN